MGPGGTFEPLAVERALLEERAAALARVTDLFEEAWREAWALWGQGLALGEEEQLAAYGEALHRLRFRRWCLLVQREALGLYRHERLDELFPFPPLPVQRDPCGRGSGAVDFGPSFPYPTHGPTGR
ncbi:MAG: hypothetical protein ACP5VN_11340 [Acidobacteriota bacterium]